MYGVIKNKRQKKKISESPDIEDRKEDNNDL